MWELVTNAVTKQAKASGSHTVIILLRGTINHCINIRYFLVFVCALSHNHSSVLLTHFFSREKTIQQRLIMIEEPNESQTFCFYVSFSYSGFNRWTVSYNMCVLNSSYLSGRHIFRKIVHTFLSRTTCPILSLVHSLVGKIIKPVWTCNMFLIMRQSIVTRRRRAVQRLVDNSRQQLCVSSYQD